MKGGGGHTIRSIWTNPDAGIHPAEKFDRLIDHKEKVLRLAHDITALSQTMEDTMRFPGETENPAINMEAKTYDPGPCLSKNSNPL